MKKTLVKIKFNSKDYDEIIKKLFDDESGDIDINRGLSIPRGIGAPICFEYLHDSYGCKVMRFSEYAAIHYLMSLSREEREAEKSKMFSITKERYGAHNYVTYDENVPFSTIWYWCNGRDNSFDSINSNEAETVFSKFFEENQKLLEAYGFNSIDDMGKQVFNNFVNYRCTDEVEFKSKYYGLGYKKYLGKQLDTNNMPYVYTAADGQNTIYLDTENVNVYALLKAIFENVFEGEVPHIDVSVLQDRIYMCDPFYSLSTGTMSSDISKIGELREEIEKFFVEPNHKISRCKIVVPDEMFDLVKSGIINSDGNIDLSMIFPNPKFEYGTIPNIDVPEGFCGDWHQLAAIIYVAYTKDPVLINYLKDGSSVARNIFNLYSACDQSVLYDALYSYDDWLRTLDCSDRPLSLVDFGEKVIENILEYGVYKQEDYQFITYGYCGNVIEDSFASEKGVIDIRTVYPKVDLGYGYISSDDIPKFLLSNWYQLSAIMYLDSLDNRDEVLSALYEHSGYCKELVRLYKVYIDSALKQKENIESIWKGKQERDPKLIAFDELGRRAIDNMFKYDTCQPENTDFHVYHRELNSDTLIYNNGFYAGINGSPYLLGLALSKAYPTIPITLNYDLNSHYEFGEKLEFLDGKLVRRQDGCGFDCSIDELSRLCSVQSKKDDKKSSEEKNKVYSKND